MNTTIHNHVKNFVFHYIGQRSVHELSIKIDGEQLVMNCSCKSAKTCKHIHSILIGRSEKLQKKELDQHQMMMKVISQLTAGKEAIQKAKLFFQTEDSCRRCNSRNIVDTRQKTLKARLYKTLSKHRYFCKDCRWSW